jgi:MFS family permease
LHFSAIKTGTWLLPAGVAVFGGARIGGLISAKYGPKYVITAGLALEALGIGLYALAFSDSTTLVEMLPGLICHGIGIGFATSQLTSVVLSDIPPEKAGSASGASGMVRQVGTSLGIALIGAIFASQSASKIRDGLKAVPGLDGGTIDKIVGAATNVDGTRAAVLLACGIVVIGALLSTLVPNIPADAGPGRPPAGH